MKTIRIGVIGAGSNTRAKHIPGLQAIDGVEIVSVCNRSRASSEEAAKAFGIPRVYDDWHALVEDDETDAIVIGTWPYLHCPVTLAALDAGKHVMCEARMAMDREEAVAMWDAARSRPELVTQVVPSPFTLNVDATVKRLVAEGFLGELIAIELYLPIGGFPDRQAPKSWRHDTALSGQNIMGVGIWYEAIMRWVGPATRVYARARTVVPTRPDPQTGVSESIGIPDHIDIVAEMACGAQFHMLMSAVIGHAGSPAAYLFGSEGTLCFRDGQLWGGNKNDDALVPVAIPDQEKGCWRVEEEFIGAIRGTEPIRLTTFEDGVRYMAFTEAVQLSLAQQSEVCVR